MAEKMERAAVGPTVCGWLHSCTCARMRLCAHTKARMGHAGTSPFSKHRGSITLVYTKTMTNAITSTLNLDPALRCKVRAPSDDPRNGRATAALGPDDGHGKNARYSKADLLCHEAPRRPA